MTFERNDGIWIFDIHRVRISQLCARYWDIFLSQSCSSKIYLYIRAIFSCSLWYLVSDFKVNIFYFWICCSIQIFLHDYIKVASFSRKMLLKLIHFKCFNSNVTWSRFKYFQLLATFATKLIHFCTSYCSF